MALSYNEYTANGTDVMFVSKPYLKEEHLAVYVDGVLQNPSSYTVSGTTVTFNSAPVVNSVVRIGRLTNQNNRLVNYEDGALLTETVLDSDANQLFYMAQEAIDRANDSITKNNAGNYSASNGRIINVSSPVDDNDVVTKGFLSPNLDNINTVANISSDITTAIGLSSEISTVASDSTVINTVANNLTSINNFEDTYSISNTAPASPTAGDLWFDTTPSELVMKVYNGSVWTLAASSVNGTANRYSYTATAGQTTFAATYDVGYVDVYLNGVKLVSGASNDFTATNGTSVVLTTGASAGDTLDIIGYGTFALGTTSLNNLTDVSTSGVANGQYLAYNSSNARFEPKNNLVTSVKDFGAVGDGVTDDTNAIQAAINSFGIRGGIVKLPSNGAFVITNLTLPSNVSIEGSVTLLDGAASGTWDNQLGSTLFVSGTINLSGQSAGIRNVAVLSSILNGYIKPTTDEEADTLVGSFSGTAFTLSARGTVLENLLVLGFNEVVTDSGNRHRIHNVRFDCTGGITVGGGSDLTKITDCHAWPYVTADLGLSTSVNYRSGVAFGFAGNCDKYLMRDLYSFGHEVGYKFLGSTGNIVQSCAAFNLQADSGNIGGSGTSKGVWVGSYVSNMDFYEATMQNNDINIQVATQGADSGGGSRLDKIKFHGGKCLEASSKFVHVVDGYVGISGMSFQKGSTATVIIDWTASDGGYITNNDFEEMAVSSGTPIINFANSTVDRLVQRIGNFQNSSIHPDNVFIDNQLDMTREVITSSGELVINTGVINVVGSRHTVDTEGGSGTDDLDTINGGVDGMRLWLRAASSSRTIVCKDATGNLALVGDFSLTHATDYIELIYEASIGGGTWVEETRSNNTV